MLLFLIHHSGFNILPASTATRIKQIFELNVEKCNQKICIKYMVKAQLYIFIQNSTYNYMFWPCILAIVRLYCKLNKQLYCIAAY